VFWDISILFWIVLLCDCSSNLHTQNLLRFDANAECDWAMHNTYKWWSSPKFKNADQCANNSAQYDQQHDGAFAFAHVHTQIFYFHTHVFEFQFDFVYGSD
jgi:hypothetical protein